jgi:AcrR family transcriptional regulator
MPAAHVAPSAPSALASKKRRLDPERTRQNILEVARAEFAEHGLSGARVDAIAARTATTKRMIYYYFGSKEGLYLAVLEAAYAGIRSVEATLVLDTLPPVEAITKVVELTFDYQESHPDFIRLVSIENIHQGKYLARSPAIRSRNATIIETLGGVLKRGAADGVFRADLDPVDLHMMISALCFFRVSNRYTFGTLFEQDFAEPARMKAHKRMIVEAVLRLLQPGGRISLQESTAKPRAARARKAA